MIWKNTVERYGAVHKTLHWLIAILVIALIIMGWIMGDIPNGPDKFWVYSLHKAMGITVLGLMVLRVLWKLANWDMPKALPTHARREQKLAWWVHWLFYGCLFAQPLSGWMLTGAANSTISWFGFFSVPNIVGPNPDLKFAMAEVHEMLPWVLTGLLALHVAGALKHAFIEKDSTLRRMLPFTAPLLLFALLPFASFAKDDVAPVWTIDRAQSHLTFEATQEGSPFKGAFKSFDGTVTLDPSKPETGNATITIDLGSIETQNAERDSTVKGADWFDTGTSPTATYKISKFEKSGKKEGELLGVGTLVLRGLEKPLDLPFTMTVEDKDGTRTAHAMGDTTLKRLDFGVGSGQWADESMVGNAVLIHVDIVMVAPKAD